MINTFQKALWIVSSIAPMLVIFSVVWYIQRDSLFISLFALVGAFTLIFIATVIFKIMKKELAILQLQVKKVSQNDKSVIGYVVSYLLPFASVAFDKYNPYIFLAISMVIFVCMIAANTPTANPLLFFFGYHFYDVETENGIGNYLVISKRSIRNKAHLKKVVRVTEYLLIDITGER